MIEVAPRLYVGNQLDYETRVKGNNDWYVLQCCKEPYHRQALGYTGMAAPRDDKEYLFAYRDNRLILNMVDVANGKFFAPAMIEEALNFISGALGNGFNVLVHCNQGGSRAPSLALLHLRRTDKAYDVPYEDAVKMFTEVYPAYLPAQGIRDYVKQNWDRADDRGQASSRA